MGSAAERARTADTPDPASCRVQLTRILASPDFDATERDRRFLAHIVEESLAGRADRIKAYTIALEVFGRDASFDPQTDPIVRVEAGHLRRALDRYYLSAGRNDPIVIAVPKGSYAPSFVIRPAVDAPFPTPDSETPATGRRWAAIAAAMAIVAFGLGLGAARLLSDRVPTGPGVPTLFVAPLHAPAGDPETGALADGLTDEIVAEIARFRDIVVVAPDGGAERSASYVLEGGLSRDGTDLGVQLRLRRNEDGAVIWAQGYRADLAEERPLAAETRIASLAATAVGQPYGAVFQADAASRAGRPAQSGDAYACTLEYFAFRATLDGSSYRGARDCLEAAVARFPNYATARALLAQIELDGRRFGLASDITYDEALAEARRALVLDPANVRALQAKMMALYLAGDFAGALKVGAAAVQINPNDTEVLGEYGYRLALSGRWDEGCAAMQGALARNPGPMPYYETGLALCAYIAGDLEEAADRIRAAAFPQLAIYHLMAAALYAEAGEDAAAAAERAWMDEHAPTFLQDVSPSIAARVGRPEDFRKFLGSLRRAGFVLPDSVVATGGVPPG